MAAVAAAVLEIRLSDSAAAAAVRCFENGRNSGNPKPRSSATAAAAAVAAALA